jgi:hypothetical protein
LSLEAFSEVGRFKDGSHDRRNFGEPMRFKRAAISDLLCGSAVAADARVTVTSMESPKNRRIDMKYLCTYLAMAFCGMLAASFVAAAQDKVVQDNSLQGKSALVVETFTAAPNMAWPHDVRLRQTETVAELRAKDGGSTSARNRRPRELRSTVCRGE